MLLFVVYVKLWEWNLNVVVIESLVDALSYFTVIDNIRCHRHPNKYFQVDGRVCKTVEYDCHRLVFLKERQFGYVVDKHLSYFVDIGAIGNAHLNLIQFITVVTREILVVLGKEL